MFEQKFEPPNLISSLRNDSVSLLQIIMDLIMSVIMNLIQIHKRYDALSTAVWIRIAEFRS